MKSAGNFIITVRDSNTATGETLEMRHWQIDASDKTIAENRAKVMIANTNRTIPAVTHTLISTVEFQHGICIYLSRGITCQGHPVLVLLKTERGGNEGIQA